MLATLGWTALLMGLAGGPHCLAMCAAPCGALVGQGGEQPVRWAGQGARGWPNPHHRLRWAGCWPSMAGGSPATLAWARLLPWPWIAWPG